MTGWYWLVDMSTKASPRLSNENDLEAMYVAALDDYLRQQDESCLHRAYELGRSAVREGRSILEMLELHQQACMSSPSRFSSLQEGIRVLDASAVFLREAMSPYEMTNRAFGEANAALQRLNETLEAEVKRLAHTLHDDAGQLLAVAQIKLGDIGRTLPADLRERLQEVRQVLDQIEDQLRGLSHELRPVALEDQGLLPALLVLAGAVSRRTGLRVTVEAAESARLPVKIETALYRIIQEALKNSSKHARASAAKIKLWRRQDLVCCSVEDDGIGFDLKAMSADRTRQGLGLLGIQERLQVLGGGYEIQSAPGQGTTLNVTIPLEQSYADPSPAR
jgi:signal transduction histidine kinase